MLLICFRITQFLDSVQKRSAQGDEASPRRGRKRKGDDDTEPIAPKQDYSDSDLQQLIAAAEESLQGDPPSTSAASAKKTPQKKTRRQSKGQRTSPRVTSNVKCSEPVVNLDEEQDDDKSSPLQGTADDDTTGEQVGTYNSLLAPTTNIAHTLQLRDTSHARALLYPCSTHASRLP